LEVFYDLGSGLGKAVILAFLLHDFSKLVGIELLEALHRHNPHGFSLASHNPALRSQDLAKSADDLILKYRDQVHVTLPEGSAPASREHERMSLIEGDFLEMDWSDADVVYANATRFDEPLMAAISKKVYPFPTCRPTVTSLTPWN